MIGLYRKMSTIFRIIYSIIRFILTLPWWLILIIVVALGIIGGWEDILDKIKGVNKNIRKTKEREEGRRRISEQIDFDSELAVKTAEEMWKSGAFETVEYETHLLEIAEKTSCIEAMVKLAEFYGIHDNDEKCKYWQKKAADAGDITCIMEYYGFSDYDVSSNAYDEILRTLENVVAGSEEERAGINYLKGIVKYKIGDFDSAKQLFTPSPGMEIENEQKYMLFKCFIAEKIIDEAEKVLDELENKEFEISAADYLGLYNYYDTEKGTTKADYDKALIYAAKYGEAQDADSNISNEITGNIYYKYALAHQNGINGFEKNLRMSIGFYEMAADKGNIDAMEYYGVCLWTGRYDDICIPRNYLKANDYLLKAAKVGNKKAQEILGKYGLEGILVLPMDAKEITYQFMDGHKLTATVSNIKFMQLRMGIQFKARILAHEFAKIYQDRFKTFDDMFNQVHGLYADQVAQMIQWGVQLLMRFNIDSYDVEAILDECGDMSLLLRVPRYVRALESIDRRAEQLHMRTAYAQATRRQWSGVGFGNTIGSTIKASVKASVAAGVMNVGSDILHSIGDNIVAAIDNSEIKGMGKAVFENPNTLREFRTAVLKACIDVGIVIEEIIGQHCHIGLGKLKGKIRFGNEELEKIKDSALDAKILNNYSVKRYEYTYALLIEKLRRYPYNQETMEEIFMCTIMYSPETDERKLDVLKQYAGDFNLDLTEVVDKIKEQTDKTIVNE